MRRREFITLLVGAAIAGPQPAMSQQTGSVLTGLAAANPPIDAARLDVVPSSVWVRGKVGRMSLRGLFEGRCFREPKTFLRYRGMSRPNVGFRTEGPLAVGLCLPTAAKKAFPKRTPGPSPGMS
jgi:hypothetical protein